MAVNDGGFLDCGASLDRIWETIDEPPSPHQQACPDCTAARADLLRLAEATREYRVEQDTSPDLDPDPALAGRILDVARAEVRRGRQLPLSEPPPTGDGDGLSISEQAVATVARRAADGLAEVQVRRCSVSLERGAARPGADPPLDRVLDRPSTVRLSLRLSVASTASIPQLSRSLRTAVSSAVSQEVGMGVARIDLAVEDLHDA